MHITRIAPVLVLAATLWAADPAVTDAKKKIAAKQYDAAITQLDTAYKANPKSAELKAALVDALMAKADNAMTDPAMPPREKYPTALRTYRQVLTVDKDNQKAKENVAMIEGIYKQMGRPIPQ
jgi:hypothetical protein